MLSRSEAEQFDTKTFDHIDGLDKMDGYISDDDLHKFWDAIISRIASFV